MTTAHSSKSGVIPVLAAIAIQLTLGVAYIWSVFQTGVANSLFGGDNARAGLTFSLLLATLTIGSVIGGKLAVRYTTRIVVFVGGIILSAGFFLASFVTSNAPWLLWVTYGIMGGVGMGFTYSTTIACAQKWYPHKKGLITGIIVSALGFGGVVFTPIVERLIENFGGRGTLDTVGGEPQTFMVLSAVFLVVCSVGSIFMKNPDAPPAAPVATSASASAAPTPAAVQRSYTPSEMLKTPQFYLIVFSFLLACMGGLMVINFARQIAEADEAIAHTATVGILAISLFNSGGRLFWGFMSDKLGRLNTIILLLCGGAVLSLFVLSANGYVVYVLIALVGFFYGGLLSNYPSLTADIFGPVHMATNYGAVLIGFGGGAIIASQIAGVFRNRAVQSGNISDMFPAFVIASCCAATGVVMLVILKKLLKK